MSISTSIDKLCGKIPKYFREKAKKVSQRLLCAVLAFSMAFSGVFGAFAKPVQAAESTEPIYLARNWEDSPYQIEYMTDRLGRIAWCIQYFTTFRSGSEYTVHTLSNKKVAWLMRQAPETIADLNHGQEIMGENISGDKLAAVIQMAIWQASPELWHSNTPDVFYYIHGDKSQLNEARYSLKPYIDYMVQEAEKHQNDPDININDIVWLQSPDSQNIVARAFEVQVTFTKASARASVTDGNNQYSLEGAQYDIFDSTNDQKVASITTDAQGHATYKLMPNRKYYAVETNSPKGYRKSTERHYFTTGNNSSEERLMDDPGRVRFTVRKKDATTLGVPQPGTALEGATYKLVDANGNSQIKTSNENGRIDFTDIPFGTITITEVKAPVGYKLDTTPHVYSVNSADHNLVIRDTGLVELEPEDDFKETPIAFDLEIAKFKGENNTNFEDNSGMEKGAAGVKFEIVSNTTHEVVGTITTDKDGFADTAADKTLWFGQGTRTEGVDGAIPYDKAGYTVREVAETVPAGYDHVDDFVITKDMMVAGAKLHYILNDQRLSTRLQLVKVDAETGNVVPLAGFSFEILDASKNAISQDVWYPNHKTLHEFTTDESGYVTLPERLVAGTYYIRETQAQAPYLLSGEDVAFTVSDNFAAAEPQTLIKIADTQATGKATIQKVEAKTDTQGTVLDHDTTLAGAEFDVIAKEDIIAPDGTSYATAGEIVDHVKTGEDGTATTKNLRLGTGSAKYAFVETKAPEGHVLDTSEHEFTLTYKDQSTAVVSATVEIENSPTHIIVDKKILGKDVPLAGAEFSIWKTEDELSFPVSEEPTVAIKSDSEAAFTLVSAEDTHSEYKLEKDENGYFVAHLPAGTYNLLKDHEKMQELVVPAGMTSYFSFSNNELETAPVLLKKDAKVETVTTNEAGKIDLLHFAKGSYRMQETEAPAGYLVSKALYSFTIDEKGLTEGKNVYVVEVKDDFTKVDISKTDATNAAEVEGAKLTVKDKDGKVIDSWVSGKEPHRIEAIPAGTYTLTEEMTPRTYDQATTIGFTVLATGEVQKVEMKDEPIKIDAKLDKRQEIADPTHSNTDANGDGKNTAATTVSKDGIYSYYLDFKNASSTWVDEFTVTDTLQAAISGLANLKSVTTPMAISDADGKLNVWFTTNKTPADFVDPSQANATLSDKHKNSWLDTDEVTKLLGEDKRQVDFTGWKLWKKDLSTTSPTTLNVDDLKLQDGEVITGIRFEYGSVGKDFTTRTDGWDRDDLKNEHDDVYQLSAKHSEKLSSAVITMQVTDAYVAGTTLDNEASVVAVRNGGGKDLEKKDEDKVTQTPKRLDTPSNPPSSTTPPTGTLHQTGDDLMRLGALFAALVVSASAIALKTKLRRSESSE